MIEKTLTTVHRHQSQMLSLYQNPLRSSSPNSSTPSSSSTSSRPTSSAESKKAQDRWSKEEEKLLSSTVGQCFFCSQILFSSATVAFRTNFLSLADFKSDLSWTNFKLPSSATWPLANIFMCDFEEKWLLNAKVSPLFWNRYVDDTFTMFHNKDSANEFLHYLNSCHSNIKFTIEFEQNNAIPFLDILVTRIQNNAFVTSIYRKKTFTGLYTKWDSFTPRKYKINLIRSLSYRYYRLCSSGSLLQSALNDLRKLLLQNGYPQGIINYHINDVLNKNRQHQHSKPSVVI